MGKATVKETVREKYAESALKVVAGERATCAATSAEAPAKSLSLSRSLRAVANTSVSGCCNAGMIPSAP